MTTPDEPVRASYLIPSRTVAGSLEEMLAQIDEAVQGLLALRHLIALQAATGGSPGTTAQRAAMRLVPPRDQSAAPVNR